MGQGSESCRGIQFEGSVILDRDSSLLRLRGAEARGPFCCPCMVNCSSVCQGFPSRCVNCKCICDVGVDDAPDASPPMADVYFENQQLD
ncbi:hypothetical protein V6N11_021219 [Hibiscus sabdariffa]|uniref:Uncharacterized protein n=1 Tax=Hibiscus sabdariffa TaxID=183260 RepID=A0ABR2NMA0_9ROSI